MLLLHILMQSQMKYVLLPHIELKDDLGIRFIKESTKHKADTTRMTQTHNLNKAISQKATKKENDDSMSNTDSYLKNNIPQYYSRPQSPTTIRKDLIKCRSSYKSCLWEPFHEGYLNEYYQPTGFCGKKEEYFCSTVISVEINRQPALACTFFRT